MSRLSDVVHVTCWRGWRIIDTVEQKKFITPKEYAQYRGISVRTVQRWLREKKLPGEQTGGKNGLWLIRWEVAR